MCQDIFPTETTRFAHVVFPAAAWSEDDGTFTSSERRVSRVRTASAAPGQAKPNWWIFKEIAKAHGPGVASRTARRRSGTTRCRCWRRALAGSSTAGWRATASSGPAPTKSTRAPASCTRTGSSPAARGYSRPWTGPRRPRWPDSEYPFVLTTGRRLYHYHTRTQTGRSEGLDDLLSEETADISPAGCGRAEDCRRRDDPRPVPPRGGRRSRPG